MTECRVVRMLRRTLRRLKMFHQHGGNEQNGDSIFFNDCAIVLFRRLFLPKLGKLVEEFLRIYITRCHWRSRPGAGEYDLLGTYFFSRLTLKKFQIPMLYIHTVVFLKYASSCISTPPRFTYARSVGSDKKISIERWFG